MTIAIEMIPADEAVYHELIERLGPAARADLARLLLEDGEQWHDYYQAGVRLDSDRRATRAGG